MTNKIYEYKDARTGMSCLGRLWRHLRSHQKVRLILILWIWRWIFS